MTRAALLIAATLAAIGAWRYFLRKTTQRRPIYEAPFEPLFDPYLETIYARDMA